MTTPAAPYAANQPWRDEPLQPHTPIQPADLKAFSAELDALHARLKSDLGPADLHHLRRMQRWGRLCTVVGYATAWMFPNPIAAVLLALGNVTRWAIVAHHVLHRGYDAVPNTPPHLRSSTFAQRWRRFIDWPDWIIPAAWMHEHNHLHHYHTGHDDDPDLVERNAWVLRIRAVPRPLKWLLFAFIALTWKLVYYAPNTLWALNQSQKIRATDPAQRAAVPTAANVWRLIAPGERLLLPVTRGGIEYWLRCVLPYAALRFGVVPALFLPLGTDAWFNVLLTSLMAEAFANLWSFLIIAPNHTGDDLHRFDGGLRGRAEFHLQQVTGSVNYTSSNQFTDFLQGYLNYQIEHHLWPDLPALKYRQAAPEVRRICERHGVPYIEQPLVRRVGKLVAIMFGDASMRRTDMAIERDRCAPAPTRSSRPTREPEAATS